MIDNEKLSTELGEWLEAHGVLLVIRCIQQTPFPLDIAPSLTQAGIQFQLDFVPRPVEEKKP